MNAMSVLPALRPGFPDLDHAAARLAMFEGQIKPNAVVEPRVLQAFATVPRETYVPADLAPLAYNDRELQWGDGQFLMSPTLLAKLFNAAQPATTETALVICSGSGYPAAIAAACFKTVVALSHNGDDSKQLRNILTQQQIDNVTVKTGPITKGWPRLGPYDIIIMCGAADFIPEAYEKQLTDGGKIIGVFPDEQHTLRGMSYLKLHNTLSRRIICDGMASYLPDFADPPHFVF